jgi:peroxiredoxin
MEMSLVSLLSWHVRATLIAGGAVVGAAVAALVGADYRIMVGLAPVGGSLVASTAGELVVAWRRTNDWLRALAGVRGVLGDARDLTEEQNERRRLSSLLVGRELPQVLLDGFLGTELAVRSGVVLYVYPGLGRSPDGGENSAMLDVAQHRAYDALERELAALDLFVLGVSSQPWRRPQQAVAGSEVRHMLLGDPEFLLAENLGLPTFEEGGVRGYRRLTLLIRRGTIGKVSYPVRSPETDPAEALRWIRAQES